MATVTTMMRGLLARLRALPVFLSLSLSPRLFFSLFLCFSPSFFEQDIDKWTADKDKAAKQRQEERAEYTKAGRRKAFAVVPLRNSVDSVPAVLRKINKGSTLRAKGGRVTEQRMSVVPVLS